MRSKDKKVIAIFLADIHLSHNPPIWRSAEPNWYAAMKRPLDEVKVLQEKYYCPVICAGDIFDRWNSPPEVINFAIQNLPDNMYAIPGQHDLPLHNYKDIERSAYWTLVEAKKIENIPNGSFMHRGDAGLTIYGFPYGTEIIPTNNQSKFLDIAVIHEYIWSKTFGYPNAPKEDYLSQKHLAKLSGYDVAVFGDNHIGFSGIKVNSKQKIEIFNCGTLMRRKSDEVDYKPQVGLLLTDGSVVPHFLDISQDKYLDIQSTEVIEASLNIKEFIQELEKLGETDLDFSDAMKQYLKKNKIKIEICNIIIKAMGL